MNEIIAFIRGAAALPLGLMIAGCGSSDAALPASDAAVISTVVMEPPILLPANASPCTEPHTVCLTVQMPEPMVMGPPTHLAVGFYKNVPVMTPADARGVLATVPLTAGEVFHLKSPDGNLMGSYYPVILLYMQGPPGTSADEIQNRIIAVDNLDYTACDSSTSGACEAARLYDFTGAAINVGETLRLVYGL